MGYCLLRALLGLVTSAVALAQEDLVYPGVFVGAGHALRPTMFFQKFNPYRVVVYRECVSCHISAKNYHPFRFSGTNH